MTPTQIARLMETEHKITESPRQSWLHYRRAKATRDRDAVWQFTDRTPGARPEGWVTIPTPPMEVLLRLEPRGRFKDPVYKHVTWQGFHDPAEFEKGN